MYIIQCVYIDLQITCLSLVQRVLGSRPGAFHNFHMQILTIGERRHRDEEPQTSNR